MPILRAVLMTRQAISPRLAIRILVNMSVSCWKGSDVRVVRSPMSERDVPVLAPRVLELLVAQHHQGAADALAGLVRQDHVVDEATRAGDEGVGEAGLVFGFARGQLGRVVLVLAEDDLHRALGAH